MERINSVAINSNINRNIYFKNNTSRNNNINFQNKASNLNIVNNNKKSLKMPIIAGTIALGIGILVAFKKEIGSRITSLIKNKAVRKEASHLMGEGLFFHKEINKALDNSIKSHSNQENSFDRKA